MGKGNGSTRASSSSNPNGITRGSGYKAAHPSIYRGGIRDGDEGWYAINDEVRGYVMTRDTRDWSSTDEPWIINGAKTISIELQRNGQDMYELDFTYDGEGKLPGIYKTRSEAIENMREELRRRFSR